jgi:putative transposase
MNQLWFTERDLRFRRAEIKGFFWEEIEQQTRFAQKHLLEQLLRLEREEQLGASWHQRGTGRRDQANGHYARDLITSVGLISRLMVPRSRRGVYRSRILNRYRRRPAHFDRWVQQVFILGLSTRRTAHVLGELLGVRALSPATVSRVIQRLHQACQAYHRRSLSDRFTFLYLDGFAVPIRGAIRQPQIILFALGMTTAGEREVVGFRVVRSEKTIHAQAFLQDLYHRGLVGAPLQLVIHDGSTALAEAASWIFPHVKQQRCCVHKLRNLADRVRHAAHRRPLLRQASAIYQAPDRATAVARARQFHQRWAPHEPHAIRLFLRDLDDTLVFYDFDRRWWNQIKSTNVLERLLREVRRRVRLVDSFRDETSCQTILYGILQSLNLVPGEHPTTITQDS